MIPLRMVLQSIEKGLKILTRRTEDMQRLLDKVESSEAGYGGGRESEERKSRARGTAKTTAKRRPPKKQGKTSKGATDTDAVLNVIRQSGAGATTAEIKERTGFSERKIWSIVAHAKRQGKIKSNKKGVYVTA